jgi:hypothetical protein
MMSNILSDLLPDAPREATILVAAAEADVAGQLQAHLAQGMNAGIAQSIVGNGFAERTALTKDACQWVVHQIAIALGVPPQDGIPAPGPSTLKPAAPTQATAPAPVTVQGQRRDAPGAFPGQPGYPGQPQPRPFGQPQPQPQPFGRPHPQPFGQPQPPGYQAPPAYPGVPAAAPGPRAYAAGPGMPALLPYDQAVAAIPQRKSRRGLIVGLTVTGVATVLVLVLVLTLLILANYTPTGRTHTAVIGQVTNVPARVLKTVGSGQAFSDALSRIRTQPSLTRNGKPELLYIGAAFCPFCAADQWPIIVALSKFGTFSNLANSRSAPKPEKYPNTATLTFDEASYSSRYLTFVTVESQTINRTPLQPATPQEKRLWNKYTQGAWPFFDIGNRFFSEALFDPAVLQGKSPSQIAAALSHPSSPIAQAVDGSANVVIAAVCSITSNQPTSVCDTPTISAIESGL